MSGKIIVTNGTALQKKYAAAGLARIKTAVKALVAADAGRAIKTKLVFLDNAATMKSYGGKPVINERNAQQNKDAIDAICKKENPDYLMILGSVDVVPHQDLRNPVLPAAEDEDEFVPSDLPYACDAPYSRDVTKFKGPTRVVGRLPDLTGQTNPAYLLGLLDKAAKYKTRKVTDYGTYFGLSALVWQGSTELSLFNMFGNSDKLLLSPPQGPSHPKAKLAPLSHFINCHGAAGEPTFSGQKGDKYPDAMTTVKLKGKIKRDTVAAAECCYGAQLYNSIILDVDMPICQEYLRHGAHGFFGSTTIAYGPEDGNAQADLITQYFILEMLDGASLGRAALVARQKFVKQVAELDPFDLKTLAQFILLGDPSLQPAEAAKATGVPKGLDPAVTRVQARGERRVKLRGEGLNLEKTKPTAARPQKGVRKSPKMRNVLRAIVREAGLRPAQSPGFTPFAVKTPAAARQLVKAKKAAPFASRYHVTVGRDDNACRVGIVAKEVKGKIVGYRIYRQR
jgi:hypothetical protein